MIFAGGHLGFVSSPYRNDPIFFLNDFMQFFDPENIGVDTKIKILCQLELEIFSKLDFRGDHFEKCPKPISRPNFFFW